MISRNDLEIDQLQRELATWMCDLDILAVVNRKGVMLLTERELEEGYDIMMKTLYFLDILRMRFDKLKENNSYINPLLN